MWPAMNRIFAKQIQIRLLPLTINRGYAIKLNGRLPTDEWVKAHEIKEKGIVARSFPMFLQCEKGKVYMWCACGRSNKQPFCDGSHKDAKFGPVSPNKPVKFVPTETATYLLCMCKQTGNRPFCSGAHVKPWIQMIGMKRLFGIKS